jgi:putative transposase
MEYLDRVESGSVNLAVDGFPDSGGSLKMNVENPSGVESVRATKGVSFHYRPTSRTRELLETFRAMVNDAIRVCLHENVRGRLKLRNRIYKEFQERYGVVSCYPYSVAEVAWSIVKKHHRWHRRPYASKLMMKMDAYNYSLHYGIISLPFRKGERILLPLGYGDYQRSFLMDSTLKRGSVTMTDSTIVIAFSKEKAVAEPLRKVGYDLNEKSIVSSNGTRIDLSEVARLNTEYGFKRRDFYSNHSNDRRLKQKFANSRREKKRVKQFLHRVSKRVVEKAKTNKEGIVLERLKGIRYAHQRGNGEGRASRRRIALWPFRQLQGYIAYKAKWEGIPVEYVSPSRTSQNCHLCGFINRKLKVTERRWLCPCGATLDRDLNAAINIERRGKMPCLGEVRPGAQGTDEAVKGNETTTPILRAEALKLRRRESRQPPS